MLAPETAVLHLFNMYGPGQTGPYAGVISKFVERAKRGLSPVIYGNDPRLHTCGRRGPFRRNRPRPRRRWRLQRGDWQSRLDKRTSYHYDALGWAERRASLRPA